MPDCVVIFQRIYDRMTTEGRTATEAAAAAQSAMDACLAAQNTPVAAPQVSVPGVRIKDPGPKRPRG